MSEWISIDEKSPPMNSHVLTYRRYSETFYVIEVLFYGFIDGKNRFVSFDISSGEEIYQPYVTHWMPLPEPPEATK